MSLDPDAIVDRRRMRRKLTFWRVSAGVVALLAIVRCSTGARARAAALCRRALISPASKFKV